MSQTSILLESGTNELEIVEFYIDEPDYRGYYGVNVAKVVEIIREQEATAMPQMRHKSVLGAFPHRDGKVVPLIDLGIFLEKGPINTKDPKIIVTEFNKILTGFLVSGVNRIHRISWSEVEDPGKFLQNISHSTITGIVKLEGRVVFILDLEFVVGTLEPSLSIRLDNVPITNIPKNEKYTILHADDSNSVRKLVKKLLESSDTINVIQASSGQEAWNTLLAIKEQAEKEAKPITNYLQAVITDIEMPQMDGLALCKEIKDDPLLKVLPVALFSSLINSKLAHKGDSVGADAQFAKPDLEELSNKLIKLIEKK